MNKAESILLVHRAMCQGGDVDLLRRIAARLVEAYRVERGIEFRDCYVSPVRRNPMESYEHSPGGSRRRAA